MFLTMLIGFAYAMPLQNVIQLQKPGFFKSRFGYAVHSKNTLFKLSKSSPDGKVLVYLQKAGVFSIRVKKTTSPKLSLYIKKHLKSYKHFGIQVKKIKKIKFKTHLAYFVYSQLTKKPNLYSTQLLLKKNQNIITLTCTGKKTQKLFLNTQCKKITKNFFLL